MAASKTNNSMRMPVESVKVGAGGLHHIVDYARVHNSREERVQSISWTMVFPDCDGSWVLLLLETEGTFCVPAKSQKSQSRLEFTC